MKLIISNSMLDKYPELRIGVLKVAGINNKIVSSELAGLKRDAVKKLRQRFSIDGLSEHPHILSWRDTYRSFGVKPKDHRPTAEALIRRVIKGEDVPCISPVVDIYLINELENLLPIGGYDTDKIDGDLFLEFAQGGEEFFSIGAKEPEYVKPGEVIYRDSSRILTRRWNYRDADYTKITEDSRNIVLFMEAAFMAIPTSAIDKAISELTNSYQLLLGGEVSSKIFSASSNNIIDGFDKS